MHQHFHALSKPRYTSALFWAYVLSAIIVIATAFLGRAALNFRAALVEKPDIAIYLLLPEDGIRHTQLLRASDTERDYLAQTARGQELIKLRKGARQWEVVFREVLHGQDAE